tara:strand:+ start:460 stop:591 length:132 start_codon:yes stop_codon:yes gene_type:complete
MHLLLQELEVVAEVQIMVLDQEELEDPEVVELEDGIQVLKFKE